MCACSLVGHRDTTLVRFATKHVCYNVIILCGTKWLYATLSAIRCVENKLKHSQTYSLAYKTTSRWCLEITGPLNRWIDIWMYCDISQSLHWYVVLCAKPVPTTTRIEGNMRVTPFLAPLDTRVVAVFGHFGELGHLLPPRPPHIHIMTMI